MFTLRAAALLLGLLGRAAACPNLCSGRGVCESSGLCSCLTGWTGADCSLRQCPAGRAWTDLPTATDTAHALNTECSNMGSCDRATGLCSCRAGFGGMACERLDCPNDCNQHGRCVSMREAAATQNGHSLLVSTSYTLWDADMVFGCACHRGFTGYDCSLRQCPLGDDPRTTGQQDEVAHIVCECDAACSGSVYVSFDGEHSAAIPHDAPVGTIEASLEALETITDVTVSLSGSTLCEAAEQTTSITFTHDPGDVPPLLLYNGLATGGATLTLEMESTQTVSCDCTACAGDVYFVYGSGSSDISVAVAHDAGDAAIQSAIEGLAGVEAGSVTATTSGGQLCDDPAATTTLVFRTASNDVNVLSVISGGLTGLNAISVTGEHGTREREACSGAGSCNEEDGWCTCVNSDFASSDGAGASGTKGDCGFEASAPTACPVDDDGDTCANNGVCNTGTWQCECFDGWTGGLCEQRTCPYGAAWFDEATAADTAHARAECSNRGLCNRYSGECACQDGFEGPACERLSCETADTAGDPCSGHGLCRTMSRLALLATDNGDAAAYTYGATPNTPATWDAEKLQGCFCDQGYYSGYPDLDTWFPGYQGYNCSERACVRGDNPQTAGDVHEQQTLACTATSGSFTLTFRQATTAAVAFDATAAAVKEALEALSTLGTVTVSYSTGAAACTGGGNTITVAFDTEQGDLPNLTADTGSLAGGAIATTATELVAGTTDDVECSDKGLCSRSTGVCACFANAHSSDGSGGEGNQADCGYLA